MTATMAVTTAEPTVDEVMGQILGELGGSLGVLLSALGIRAGLWAAMAGERTAHPGRRGGADRPVDAAGTGVAAGTGGGGLSALRPDPRAVHPAASRGGGDAARAGRRDDRRLHEHVVLDGRRLRRIHRGVPGQRRGTAGTGAPRSTCMGPIC